MTRPSTHLAIRLALAAFVLLVTVVWWGQVMRTLIASIVRSCRARLQRRAAAMGLLVLVLAAAPPGAEAQGDPAGLSALLTPLLVVGLPLHELHALFSGEAANRHANEALRQERLALSLAAASPVPVHGLYVGRIPMQLVLKDSLGYLAIPSVEMDSAAAGWLLSGLDDPEALSRQAAQHAYVRAAVAEDGDGRCVHSGSKDWIRQLPFPGHRCLALEFVDTLASDVELRLDTGRLKARHLEWQIVERGSQAVRFASPFWSAYPERQGSQENAVEYRFESADYSNALALALEQLAPAVVARDDRGLPLALRWVKAHQQVGHPGHYKSIPVVLGAAEPAPDRARSSPLSWADQVDLSYGSQTGRMVAGRYAVVPTRDLVLELGQVHAATYFVFGTGVYSAQIGRQEIFIMKFRDDALPAWGLALELDKAPELGLCTEKDKLRCATVLDVASISADSVRMDIHVLGWMGKRVSYPVTIPGSRLAD